jgi:hypothetical protein
MEEGDDMRAIAIRGRRGSGAWAQRFSEGEKAASVPLRVTVMLGCGPKWILGRMVSPGLFFFLFFLLFYFCFPI